MEMKHTGGPMWHTDCPKNKWKSGPMQTTNEFKEGPNDSQLRLWECVCCNKKGWWGIEPKTRLIVVEA